jgi:hypothetical protein
VGLFFAWKYATLAVKATVYYVAIEGKKSQKTRTLFAVKFSRSAPPERSAKPCQPARRLFAP